MGVQGSSAEVSRRGSRGVHSLLLPGLSVLPCGGQRAVAPPATLIPRCVPNEKQSKDGLP